MSEQKLLYVEMDCPRCALVYGTAPCAAPILDPDKCKNTAATCKDIAHYTGTETHTLRWVKSASYVPESPYAIPSLNAVQTSSQRINPAENLGKRERVTASFFNHRHNDIDLDPYVDGRVYNAYEQGTYWGKFAAMYPNVQGYPVRVIHSDTDGNSEISHYIADEGAIVGDKTGYSLSAKDVLDFAEGNKTLCPTPNTGILSAAVAVGDSSFTLSPVGVGNAEYPLAFEAYIGNEWVQCTRVGDVVTFVQRGMFSTAAVAHEKDDTLQVAEVFTTQNVSQILTRLLAYTSTPPEYYNQAQWDQQVAIVSSPSLTARIGQPTPVFELLQDLMKDMALDIHTDVVNKKIVMEFLINKIPTLSITDDNMDDPDALYFNDKRCDLFLFSFGRKNPLLKMDTPNNYPATIVRASTNAVVLALKNPPAIRRHFSRWVSGLLRAQASQTTAFTVGRYEFAPRGLGCKMKNDLAPVLAQIVNVKTSIFEDAYGRTPTIPMQVMSASRGQAHTKLELEEFRALPFDPNSLLIIISLTESAVLMGEFSDMRGLYNSVYPTAIPVGAVVRFEASFGVAYGGYEGAPDEFALVMGDWPEVVAGNCDIEIVGLGIAGFGGSGGGIELVSSAPAYSGSDGSNGGAALYTRVPVTLIDCVVGGGGGGGGGSASDYSGSVGQGGLGGTGAGFDGSGIAMVGGDGTEGDGAIGGSGGALGQDGAGGMGGNNAMGGFAGLAIDGASFVTLSGTTTVYGSQIN